MPCEKSNIMCIIWRSEHLHSVSEPKRVKLLSNADHVTLCYFAHVIALKPGLGYKLLAAEQKKVQGHLLSHSVKPIPIGLFIKLNFK